MQDVDLVHTSAQKGKKLTLEKKTCFKDVKADSGNLDTLG